MIPFLVTFLRSKSSPTSPTIGCCSDDSCLFPGILLFQRIWQQSVHFFSSFLQILPPHRRSGSHSNKMLNGVCFTVPPMIWGSSGHVLQLYGREMLLARPRHSQNLLLASGDGGRETRDRRVGEVRMAAGAKRVLTPDFRLSFSVLSFGMYLWRVAQFSMLGFLVTVLGGFLVLQTSRLRFRFGRDRSGSLHHSLRFLHHVDFLGP